MYLLLTGNTAFGCALLACELNGIKLYLLAPVVGGVPCEGTSMPVTVAVPRPHGVWTDARHIFEINREIYPGCEFGKEGSERALYPLPMLNSPGLARRRTYSSRRKTDTLFSKHAGASEIHGVSLSVSKSKILATRTLIRLCSLTLT